MEAPLDQKKLMKVDTVTGNGCLYINTFMGGDEHHLIT